VIQWAKGNGYTVSKEWIVEDRGYSGSEETRPGLQKLLKAVKKKPPFSAIIALDYTRFSRSEELFYWLRREFRKSNVTLVSATEHGDEELVVGVKAIIGAEQRRQVAKRTKLALHHIAGKGLRCGGTAPYGYKRVALPSDSRNRPVTLEPDPEQARVVRRIFGLRAKGTSVRRIAHKLNAEGILTSTGRSWTATKINYMLDNEVYIGNVVYGRRRQVQSHPFKHIAVPEREWKRVEGAYRPIIKRELWDRVQEISGNGQRRNLGGRQVRPLSGLVYCGECGSKYYIGSGSKGGGYACYKRRCHGPTACSNKRSILASKLEAAVDGVILKALESPRNVKALRKAIKETLKHRRRAAATKGPEKAAIRSRLRAAEGELGRHVEFIGKTGKEAPTSLLSEIRRLEARIASLKMQLEPPPAKPPKEPTEKDVTDHLKALGEALRTADPERKRMVYRELIRRIVVYPDRVDIEGNPPGFAPKGLKLPRETVQNGHRFITATLV
jgi:site-specific DNA recombinase